MVFNGTSAIAITLAIVCPLVGAIVIVGFRHSIAARLAGVVPQQNPKKITAAVFVGAFAIATFIAGWILAVLVQGSPPALWLSIFGVAILAWIVVWALLANET